MALTGELTLHGKILRTHGIKEKVLLARREKINQVIVPYDNEADVSMLPDNIKEGVKFYFVSDFQEVYKLLFPLMQKDATTPIAPIAPSPQRAEAIA